MENAKKILKCWPLHVTLLIVVVACEWINTIKIPTPIGNILLLPMLYAIVITLVLSLQKPIKWMKQEASEVSSDFVVFGISLFLAKVAHQWNSDSAGDRSRTSINPSGVWQSRNNCSGTAVCIASWIQERSSWYDSLYLP